MKISACEINNTLRSIKTNQNAFITSFKEPAQSSPHHEVPIWSLRIPLIAFWHQAHALLIRSIQPNANSQIFC
jgi:hypothetical protein